MEILISLLRQIMGDTISIFTIMNSLSAGAIMLTLVSEDTSDKEFRTIAQKNSKAVFISMALIFALGTYIFNFFGISADSLKVFGGIILLNMGINMVRGYDKKVNSSPKEKAAAMEQEDVSVVPMAIPIIVGPGLATTLITMSIDATSWTGYASGFFAILVCSITNFIILGNMVRIKKRLGVNGLKVLNRLLGLIVGSLAAQMIIIGIKALWA
ncbi:MAG: MarC family protein [Schleiferiaceae bacterium]|nr:MarC family protein [Schleiferiaceae bacterium]